MLSEKKKVSNKRYLEKLVAIQLRIDKITADCINKAIENSGKSKTEYILNAIKQQMLKDGETWINKDGTIEDSYNK